MQLPPVERSTTQWRPPSADLYSTGASGAVAVRPVNPVNPVESIDRLGEGVVLRDPLRSPVKDEENHDWTLPIDKKAKPKEVEEPPPPKDPPLYKLMLEHVQALWRASGTAVDVVQEVSKAAQIERQAMQEKKDEPLTYQDTKVKRTAGL